MCACFGSGPRGNVASSTILLAPHRFRQGDQCNTTAQTHVHKRFPSIQNDTCQGLNVGSVLYCSDSFISGVLNTNTLHFLAYINSSQQAGHPLRRSMLICYWDVILPQWCRTLCNDMSLNIRLWLAIIAMSDYVLVSLSMYTYIYMYS